MSIDEYKKNLISIIEAMNEEHGCSVSCVEIKKAIMSEACGVLELEYRVEIEM